MSKPLSELLKKVNPEVVLAAKEQAELEIIEFQLSTLRELLKLSQVDMSLKLGISQPSVANLEKRGQQIKISSLKRYASAMGCKLTINVESPDGRCITMLV